MADSQPQEPSVEESLTLFLESHLADIHTALPAKIERYDAATGKADVKPVILRIYEDEDGKEVHVPYPVITNVPVMNPRGGGAFISLPLKSGDPVWVFFAQRSLDRYLESDGRQDLDSEDARKHHLSDAFAYPGGGTFRNHIPNAHTDDLVIGLENGKTEVHITPSGEVQIKAEKLRLGGLSASTAVARADRVDARLSALEAQVALPHGTPLGPTVPPPFVPGAGGASTASAKVFADG